MVQQVNRDLRRVAGHAAQVHIVGSDVQMPLPDFSMPYNVACMTCTVLAVFIVSLLNMFR